MMGSAIDLRDMNLPGIRKEVCDELIATFDTLSNWRDEIESVNERSLTKVLDQTSAVARSMGWPVQAVSATRDYLENASKMQTTMIDQFMAGWKTQLNSPIAPMAMPRSFNDQMPQLSGSTFAGAMPFSPLAPWTFWMQAAEMWQRTWMPDTHPRRHRTH
jgi:hypothetical protein